MPAPLDRVDTIAELPVAADAVVIGGERPGEIDALLLPAREFSRPAMAQAAGQAHHV